MTGDAPRARDEPAIELGNEFAQVVVEQVRTRNGVRLRISVPASGRAIQLCPLQLEALTWATPELFSALLATPHGPEDEPEPAARPAAELARADPSATTAAELARAEPSASPAEPEQPVQPARPAAPGRCGGR